MRRWRWPLFLSLSGITLIMTAVSLGAISWLAFQSLGNQSSSRRIITPTVIAVDLPAASQNRSVSQLETPLPALTANLPGTLQPETNVNIDLLIQNMSLEEKVGQMIMTGIPGGTFDGRITSLIETYHFGSVVYFAENIHSPAQILKLSQDLQRTAANSGHGVPLLIAVDHEGGEVFRFTEGLTHFANPMTLGAAASPDLAYLVAAASAQELKAVGINTSLGPVLDINDEPLNPVIGVRAFGAFPDLVTKIGMAYLRGLQDNGVIAAAKHYPGHGSTIEDSHILLPIVNKTEEQLVLNELIPYRSAIKEDTGIILVSHVAFPQVDPSGAPATLSTKLIHNKLRVDLGYPGVVMTDAMTMGAITNRYTVGQAALLAVQAGNDLLAYPELEMAVAAYSVILAAVRDGSINQARIDESVRRILKLKAIFNLFDFSPAPELGRHQILARQAAQAAVVFSGKGKPPLLSIGKLLLVTPDELLPGNVGGDNLSLLGELLEMQGLEVYEWNYSVRDPELSGGKKAQLQRMLPEYPQAVIVLWDAMLRRSETGGLLQYDLVEVALNSGVPVVFVASNSPYDLGMLPPDQPALATFGRLDYQVDILAQALLSEVLPTGKMPVFISR